MRDETKCLHEGHKPKNSEPRVLPIIQSTTYVYDSTEEIAAVFADPMKSLIYSRFGNPTVMAVEDKISALEGGIGAMCTTSGQAATLLSILNICNAGDSFISTSEIYGTYITKARMQIMRDFGVYPAAHSAFLLNLGLETLAIRMKRYCENASSVVQYLKKCDEVESVFYPDLPEDRNYPLAQKYLKGCSGVISFVIKGGRNNAMTFMNQLSLASNEVHVADIRTCVLHPASETHRQLTDEQLKTAGISGGMVRFSVGLENVEDIIEDLENVFSSNKGE